MKFVKSLSLPVLSLALLLPMANASALDVKATASDMYAKAGEVAGKVASAAGHAKQQAGEYASHALQSAKAHYVQMPSFEQMRMATVQKLGLENKGIKEAFADAKDAVVTYSLRHPWVAGVAVIAAALGAGYWIGSKLKRKKTA